MNIFHKKLFICSASILFVNLAMTNLTYASWPIFTAPDQEYLLKNNYIDTINCPPGQGRIVLNSTVPMQPLCRTSFCPSSWLWKIVNSDNECHKISTDFALQGINIKHYKESNGTSDYSVVTGSFGKKQSSEPYFKVSFTTAPHEHWYCIEMNPELHTITCANDI